MGYPLAITGFSHVWGVRLRLDPAIPSFPETTQEKRAVLHHPFVYFDLRCHLPCIFPLACQLPTSSDCGPPVLFPRNVDEIPTFDQSKPTHQALPSRHVRREYTRYRASRRVPRSAGCSFCLPGHMFRATGPGRRVLRVPHNGEHVRGRSRCSRRVEGFVLCDSELGGRATPAPCYHGILILGWPRQRAVDVQCPGIMRGGENSLEYRVSFDEAMYLRECT